MSRKRAFSFAFVLLCLALPALAQDEDEEISLFNSKGKATAYIAENRTIYLWDGKPVAYLEGKWTNLKDGMSIYGFNGKHLGWFKDGTVFDHEGDAVGGIEEVFKTPVGFEPFKAFKKFEPFKSFKQFAPIKPLFHPNTWSASPLKSFLNRGAKDADEDDED